MTPSYWFYTSDAAKKAADDARALEEEEEERVISPNLGIVTSKIALSDDEGDSKHKIRPVRVKHSRHGSHRKSHDDDDDSEKRVNGETEEKNETKTIEQNGINGMHGSLTFVNPCDQ